MKGVKEVSQTLKDSLNCSRSAESKEKSRSDPLRLNVSSGGYHLTTDIEPDIDDVLGEYDPPAGRMIEKAY